MMQNYHDFINALPAAFPDPLRYNCRNAIEVKQHHILPSRIGIMETVQNGIKNPVEQSAECRIKLKGNRLGHGRQKQPLMVPDIGQI